MQKVVGSSPIIRSPPPLSQGRRHESPMSPERPAFMTSNIDSRGSLVRAQYRPFTKETCRGPTDLKHAGRANAAFDRPQSSCGPRNLYAERTSLKSLSPPVVPAATVLSSPPNPDGAP